MQTPVLPNNLIWTTIFYTTKSYVAPHAGKGQQEMVQGQPNYKTLQRSKVKSCCTYFFFRHVPKDSYYCSAGVLNTGPGAKIGPVKTTIQLTGKCEGGHKF